MESVFYISLLTILRLGIPGILLLVIGEAVKNRYEKFHNS